MTIQLPISVSESACFVLEEQLKNYMKKKLIITNRYRTSALFRCEECEEEWQDLETSREQAYNHAKKTGHKVTGEIGTAYHYNF